MACSAPTLTPRSSDQETTVGPVPPSLPFRWCPSATSTELPARPVSCPFLATSVCFCYPLSGSQAITTRLRPDEVLVVANLANSTRTIGSDCYWKKRYTQGIRKIKKPGVKLAQYIHGRDAKRTAYIESKGYTVKNIWQHELPTLELRLDENGGLIFSQIPPESSAS